ATGSATQGRLLNSAFWGAIVVGRLIAVPLALRFSPLAMLAVDLLGAVASLLLIAAAPESEPALWLGTLGLGCSIASMIPSSFNLAARRMPITSEVSATFLVGGSLGSMTLPWIVGQLIGPYGRLSVIHVTAAAMLAAAALFVVIARSGPRRSAMTLRTPAREPALRRG
ncbi:MAG TPA: hypothetical protein VEY67_09385, partial [Candidatus Dormibacteraeota bacterium]|nr:hypothetical protein [Candidatus Dormibacteraeota bacterium]